MLLEDNKFICPLCESDVIAISSGGNKFYCPIPNCHWEITFLDRELKLMALQQWHLRSAKTQKYTLSKKMIEEINKTILTNTAYYSNSSYSSLVPATGKESTKITI